MIHHLNPNTFLINEISATFSTRHNTMEFFFLLVKRPDVTRNQWLSDLPQPS